MSRAAGVGIFLALAAATSSAAEKPAAVPDPASPRAVAESFARLTFDFCAAVVARRDATVADIGRGLTGFRWDGPKPLSEAGRWSEPLQDRLRAQPDTQVYKAITSLTSVDAFHLAYARVDGESCVVIAQQIPDVATLAVKRLETDKSFHLITESPERRVFGHPAGNGSASFIVTVPTDTRGAGIVDIGLHRQDVRPPVTEAALGEWLGAVIAGCRASIEQGREVATADFGEFLEENTGKDGSLTLQSPVQYPAAILFRKPAPRFGCELMLTGGERENRLVVDELLGRLAARRDAGAPASPRDEHYAVAGPGGSPAMRLRVRDSGDFLTTVVIEAR